MRIWRGYHYLRRTTGLTLTGSGSTLTLGDILTPANGGFGADVSAYSGLPIFTAGVVSDLTGTKASGASLEMEGGSSGKWYKFLTPDSY